MSKAAAGVVGFDEALRVVLAHAVDLATPATVIRQMTPEKIFATLTTGSMQKESEGLSDAQKRRIAEFMSGRPMGSSKAGNAKDMPNKCASNPAMGNPAASPGWNGWADGGASVGFRKLCRRCDRRGCPPASSECCSV